MYKRGQATILIFIGIILVGLVAGVYYSRDYVFKSKMERLSEKSLVVPKQAENVRDYVMSCVKQVSEEAVDIVGQKGGFIDVPGEAIPAGPYNKFSNSLNVISDLRVPYWYYKAANNIDKYQVLNIQQIQENIKKYVDENLRICMGTFESFKKQGYVINPGLIDADAEIQNDKVVFGIKFPVHMEIKDFSFDFKEFYYRSDKPLGELYDASRSIFNYENGKLFLEEKTMDMMVGYEEIPLTGERFDCGFVPVWSKVDVLNKFKQVLGYNIPSLKIMDSDYKLKSDDRSYFEVDTGNVGEDISVGFMYSENWPFEFEVMPDDGGVLKAKSTTDGMGKIKSLIESVVCYNTWHFVYSIKYPVLVVLNKDGYTFQFAYMVVIDRNRARENTIPIPDTPEIDKRYCENRKNNLNADVFDQFGNPINNVELKFKCINHLCDFGVTSGNSYSGLVMPCYNGFVIANKEGYHSAKTQVSTLTDNSVIVEMYKYKELDVNVEVVRGGAGQVREDETAYITMYNDEDTYVATAVYPRDKKIKLMPGNYNVDLYLIRDGELSIPSRETRLCVDIPERGVGALIGETEEQCITTKIPGIKLEKVTVGAANYDFTVSSSDLTRNKITFYIPYQGVPKTHEDLSRLTIEGDVTYPKFS